MKAKREHRIPLSPRCISLLTEAKSLSAKNDGYVFPGRLEGKSMSNMVFLMTLRRMKIDVTAHGFRSSFRDWAAEQTGFPSDVCEMALAHTIKNKVEAAYRRGDLFEKRRALMGAWAEYVVQTGESSESAHGTINVNSRETLALFSE
jgi:integrase